MLLDEIEAFLTETGMAASRFGRDFARSPQFVGRLRDGGNVMESTASEIRAKMAAHRKKNAKASPAPVP